MFGRARQAQRRLGRGGGRGPPTRFPRGIRCGADRRAHVSRSTPQTSWSPDPAPPRPTR